MWMDIEIKWSKSDEDKNHKISPACGIEKMITNELNKNRLTDIETKLIVTNGISGRGRQY